MRDALAEAAPAVRRYLFGMCGDWDTAEDVAQDALMTAWRKRHQFDGRAEPQTWLLAIARNRWLDHLRRRRRRPPPGDLAVAEAVSDPARSPDETAVGSELAEAVRRAMAGLPDEQREALALRESGGLTFAQIGDLVGTSAATVKSRVRYALLKLAADLKPFSAEIEP